MIGFLRGVLMHKEPPQLVVDVGGVGYEVEAPMSTWTRLPALGEEVHLRTHLVIREDQHLLFGFSTEAERRLFRDLIKVSGVGARIALAILSGITVEGFVRCVQVRDTAALTKVPGVGRKTAERLVVEMSDRIEELTAAGVVTAATVTIAGSTVAVTPETEVMNALLSLGYKSAEARRMIEQAGEARASTAELLRAALKAAAPSGRL
jgi:Holliday junction DNA helicase RuvA